MTEQMIRQQISQIAMQEMMKGTDPDKAIKEAEKTVEKILDAAKRLASKFPEETQE